MRKRFVTGPYTEADDALCHFTDAGRKVESQGLAGQRREITAFVLDLVRDFMRKAFAMGSLLQRGIRGSRAGLLLPMGSV